MAAKDPAKVLKGAHRDGEMLRAGLEKMRPPPQYRPATGRPAAASYRLVTNADMQIYRAEQDVRERWQDDTRWSTLAQVQAYIDAKLASITAQYTSATVPLTVRYWNGETAQYFRSRILIPDGPWARRSLVIDHEIAHHLTPRAEHGPDWWQAFLFLLEPHHATAMKEALDEQSQGLA